MKKFSWFTVLITSFLLLGCFEVNEEVVIDQNGAGTFVTKMDMAQLVEMMQAMGGDEMNKEGLDKIIDSTISMASAIDSAKDLTSEQRDLLKDGKMRVQMNLKEKVFKIDTDIKFKNYSQLKTLLGGGGGGSMSVFGDLMKKVMGGKETEEKQDMPDSPKDPSLDQVNTIFDVEVKDGLISKKLNKAKYDELMAKPEMEQMKQASGMGMELMYTTTIKLPRPVKTSDNPAIKLSSDKKTVTIKYNYLDAFENPDKLAYNITF